MPVNPPRFFECPAPKHLERPALVAKSGKPLKRVLTGFTGGCGRSCSGMCCPLCGKTGIRLVAFIDAAGVHMIGGQWRANPKKTRSISYRIGSGCGDSPLDFSYWRDTGTNMFPDRTTNQEAINEKEYKAYHSPHWHCCSTAYLSMPARPTPKREYIRAPWQQLQVRASKRQKLTSTRME